MRIPELEKKIGSPLARIIWAHACNRIQLRNVGKIFHASGSPDGCGRIKLDARRNRVSIRLVDNGRSDREYVMRSVAHVNVWKNIAPCHSAACTLTKRST